MMKRAVFTIAIAGMACAGLATAAVALDLNSFRAQHGRPALSVSSMLAGLAYSHAHDMANRKHLDHNGFRQRMSFVRSAAAENVAFGCESEDCVFQMWAKSAGHRANMLRGDVTSYGLALATADNGRRYWVLELGN